MLRIIRILWALLTQTHPGPSGPSIWWKRVSGHIFVFPPPSLLRQGRHWFICSVCQTPSHGSLFFIIFLDVGLQAFCTFWVLWTIWILGVSQPFRPLGPFNYSRPIFGPIMLPPWHWFPCAIYCSRRRTAVTSILLHAHNRSRTLLNLWNRLEKGNSLYFETHFVKVVEKGCWKRLTSPWYGMGGF